MMKKSAAEKHECGYFHPKLVWKLNNMLSILYLIWNLRWNSHLLFFNQFMLLS